MIRWLDFDLTAAVVLVVGIAAIVSLVYEGHAELH
jgi:hypothetical protein